MMRRFFLTLLFLLPVAACAQDEITYEEFLDKHMDAMGGKERLENLRSIETRVLITENDNPITNNDDALNGHFRANRDGQMRIDIIVDGKRAFTEALSSLDSGWQQDGEGAEIEPLSEAGKAALQKSVHSNLYALHELPGLGYKVEYQGIQDLMNQQYYAVDVTSPTGKFERHFFDMETFLRAATMDESALHVDVDPTKILNVSTDTDYRMVDGVMHSFAGEVIDLRTNKVIQIFKLLEIEINGPQDKTQFEKP